nr:unnamed protein product [Callosobruchus analis]
MDDHQNDDPPVLNLSPARIAAKVVILLLLTLLTRYTMYSKDQKALDDNLADTVTSTGDSQESNTSAVQDSDTKIIMRKVVLQPACPKSEVSVILGGICEELVMKHDFCTPEDIYNHKKHQLPKINVKNNSNKEPQVPAIVNFFVGFVLLSSLFAAFLEVYRARRAAAASGAGGQPVLSRKCSLAELTILKHQRKEMARRESLAVAPHQDPKQHHQELSARLLMDFRSSRSSTPVLQRCSSFPVTAPSTGVAIGCFDANIPPIPECPTIVPEVKRRQSIVPEYSDRRQSVVVESRRQSIVVDVRRQPSVTEGRRMSVTEVEGSPERRHHHSRLVHRLH